MQSNWDNTEMIADWVEYDGKRYFAMNGETPDKVELFYCATVALHYGHVLHALNYDDARRHLKRCELTDMVNSNFFINQKL